MIDEEPHLLFEKFLMAVTDLLITYGHRQRVKHSFPSVRPTLARLGMRGAKIAVFGRSLHAALRML